MKIEVTLDCQDLEAVTSFWGSALDCPVTPSIERRHAEVSFGELTVNFQRVAEPKAGKNRVHLDLLVEDLSGELARLEALGAVRRESHAEFDQTWYVLGDPEGNEFCLAQGGD